VNDRLSLKIDRYQTALFSGKIMPKTLINDRDIHYKILGTGEPLLLIIGLSFSLLDWGTEFPDFLSQHYQVILFDNRAAILIMEI
jgi:hypothetical protein